MLKSPHELNIVTLCTGNVARSVMLGYMLTALAEANGEDWRIRTAGTHVIEESAMSSRTKDALVAIPEMGEHRYGSHRSHQLTTDDVLWADIILTSEAAHVRFVRTHYPDHGFKAVQLFQFVREAPLDESIADQLLAVSWDDPSDVFDVEDPAGGDQERYNECATQLWGLAQAFATLVSSETFS
jgi:protein-tyrosine-phosphatase